jgi:methyl-accepting chemotaxis protein
MRRRRTFGISAKLSLLSLTFAMPTAYLLWLLIGQQQIAIGFAAREVDGAHALATLVSVQAAASRAVLQRQAATDAAARLRTSQPELATDLGVQQAFDATVAAFGQGSDAAAVSRARGKLRDLIAQIGDRSNLILDNVLETYYLTDVVLNRLPEVIDRVADLAVAETAANDPQAKAHFLADVGAFSSAIDGMDASLIAAEQDNADRSITGALQASYQPLHGTLEKFRDSVSSGAASAMQAGTLMTDLSGFDDRAVGELHRLLRARVAMLTWAGRTQLAVSSLLYVASLLLVLLVMNSRVSRPIDLLAEITTRLAAGELSTEVPAVNSRDEVGALTAALLVFKDSMVKAEGLTADRDAMQQKADAEKHMALVNMAEKIEAETGAGLAAVGARTAAMSETAQEMSASAGRTGTSAQAAATAAANALANAQTVASAAEQLAASIREIGAQVSQSTTVVGSAVAAGSETRTMMEALNEQVGRIGVVAEVIGEIAARTNLLALNATIEAARAGDAGKGFAVVASEVKQLATQTARSTEEITRHIGDVRAAASASVASVRRIERTIGEVDAIAGSIAAAVEQQGAATAEIARNVTETAASVHEMTRRIDEVSAEAEKTGQSSAQVMDDTATLNTTVIELQRAVVRTVRTSTAEVDRRQTMRHPVDLGCRLSVAGGDRHVARVIDLSYGGAAVAGAPMLPIGTRGTLEVDRIDMKLPFVGRTNGGETLHLAFELDAESAGRFTQMLDRTRMQHAA